MASDNEGQLPRPVALVGFMAAGKTKIGRLLAERLKLPFVDSDAEIETAFGMTVAEIFGAHGEPAFRDAERRLVSNLLESGPKVIAVGGGAFIDRGTREMLNGSAHTVWLDPVFDLIAQRLARSKTRPLASGRSDAELRQLWEQRRPFYAEAHVRVRTSDGDPRLAVDQIVQSLAS